MTGEDRLSKWLLKVIEQEGVAAKLESCASVQRNGMRIDIGKRSCSEARSEDGCLNAWIDGPACGWSGWSSAAVDVWSKTRGENRLAPLRSSYPNCKDDYSLSGDDWLSGWYFGGNQVKVEGNTAKIKSVWFILSNQDNFNLGWILLACWCEPHFYRIWG